MVEIRIRTNEYIYRRVKANGRVNINELDEYGVKLIPIPYLNKPVATQNNDSSICISLKSNEVIYKEIKGKKQVYVAPIYDGVDMLVVPETAEIWIKKPPRTYNKNTIRVKGSRKLVLGKGFREQVVSVYQPQQVLGNNILINELFMRPVALLGTNRCYAHLPRRIGTDSVKVFIDEIYEY